MIISIYRFYQGPLMVNEMLVGLVFCNTSFIQDIAVELQNVSQNYFFSYF